MEKSRESQYAQKKNVQKSNTSWTQNQYLLLKIHVLYAFNYNILMYNSLTVLS